MKGSVNTTGVKPADGTFELLPKGEYIFDIIDWKEGVNKNNDPFVKVEFEVATGDQKGRKIWDNITFPSPNSPGIGILGLTKHFLHCIGEPFEGDIEYDTDRWMCRQVRIEVVHKAYEGKDYAKVGRYILDETLNSAPVTKNPGGVINPEEIAWDE